MKKPSKKTLARIDELMFAAYPGCRKVVDDLSDRDFEEFSPIAFYIVKEIPGADKFGFNEDENGVDKYMTVAVEFCVHEDSGRIFFFELNRFSETNNGWGESDGEFVDGELVHEAGLEIEI